MLWKTEFKTEKTLLKECMEFLENFSDFKTSLNYPTGNFFYDKWSVKNEYKNTVFERVLSALPNNIGEARVIKLDSGKCYLQHADIDDRYHYNLAGDNSFLVDVDNNSLHELKADGIWYEMDAGRLHSAINIGLTSRYQIVVRKLLNNSELENSKNVRITPICEKPRFYFDNLISPWLNYANKKGIINSFEVENSSVKFAIEKNYINELEFIEHNNFIVEIE